MESRDKKTTRSSPSPTPVDPKLEDWHPKEIGPYRVLRVLGEGGMGTVYLAEQEVPIRRLVAVKLIKLGHDTVEVLQRFEQERQALSMMSHPNIAGVLDAGAAKDGRPFFVMEHVPGIRISDYCDQNRLSIRERLELFIQVCDGIQHAHQKGIIHRDIKPSNVLVTLVEGKPLPKIIDFGLALATEVKLTEQTLYTRQGQWIGTPEYMSPEQAGAGVDVDTRADIYSLGVLLYELLTGHLPFESWQLREAGLAEIQRTIQEVEPPKPSTRVSSISEALSTADLRGCDSPTLAKRLRGDLDWIVMRALEKDRNRRYASSSELSADIKRHLNHEAVLAGPPSWSYRAFKFLRRYRLQVGAAAAVVISLIIGIIAAVSQYRRAEQNAIDAQNQTKIAKEERRKAVDARGRAEEERKKAVEQEGIAKKAAADAKQAAAEANRQRARFQKAAEVARQQAKRADESFERFKLLANVGQLDNLLRTQTELWPSWPENYAKLRAWTSAFRGIELQLPRVRAELRRIERRIAAFPKEQQERVKQLESKYKDRRIDLWLVNDALQLFSDIRERQEMQLLLSYVDLRLDEFLRDKLLEFTTTLEESKRTVWRDVRRRLQWARVVEPRSVQAEAARWITAIKRVAQSPLYGGLKLLPQLGLVPVGPDPETGLEEFIHLASSSKMSARKVPLRDRQKRLRLTASDGIIFVLIPARAGAAAFMLAKHEVTQAQWRHLAKENPSVHSPDAQHTGSEKTTMMHPVENISFDEAERILQQQGFVVPSVDEWRWAASGGRTQAWPSGDSPKSLQGHANLADAWFDRQQLTPDGFATTAPIGRFGANAFGLHDCAGNVAEWCRASGKNAETCALGGSWRQEAEQARLDASATILRNRRSDSVGIRPLRPLIDHEARKKNTHKSSSQRSG